LIGLLNHLYDFDDVLINIYQMKHQYKQQEENQNRVITENNCKIEEKKMII
jgi:hypothetical protein